MIFCMLGFAAYEQTELYNLAIESILSNAFFVAFFIQIYLYDFHYFSSDIDAILNGILFYQLFCQKLMIVE
jgi:hypothetical protein